MLIYLVPFERVAEFEFNSDIKQYFNQYEFDYTPVEDITDYEIYEIEDLGISLYVENDVIESIVCRYECLYKGRNIIGMDIDEFINFYDVSPSDEVDSVYVSNTELQYVYEFDELGLQIWCNQNNEIVTVIADGDE